MLLTHFLSHASIVIICELIFSVNRPSGGKKMPSTADLVSYTSTKRLITLKKYMKN